MPKNNANGKRFNFVMPEELYNKLNDYAEGMGVSKAGAINFLLSSYFLGKEGIEKLNAIEKEQGKTEKEIIQEHFM